MKETVPVPIGTACVSVPLIKGFAAGRKQCFFVPLVTAR